MSIIVQKFGGTSLGTPERIQAVADRVIQRAQTQSVVVVVSAMGHTTDELIALAKQLSKEPDGREYDALIATGEMISASLLALAIQAKGHKAISLTGAQAGILTEDVHTKSKILSVKTERIYSELSAGHIVIVTGFQGVNSLGDVVTIGRGGSDTSAVVLAGVLKAPACDIFTDVDGVYTTDPRMIKNASKLATISYDEMLELAALGAKVLHPRSVECAKEHGVVIHVRSSFSNQEGTYVQKESLMEVQRPVTGATLSEEDVVLSMRELPDIPGIASEIFSQLAISSVNVDMIVQSASKEGTNSISFTVHEEELSRAKRVLESVVAGLGRGVIQIDTEVSKLSIVGVGMISKPGVAAKMFEVFATNKMNIKLISTSEIKISCVISRKDGRQALEDVHSCFGLDSSA